MKNNIKNDVDLDKIWSELAVEAENKTNNGIFVRRIMPKSKCDLFLGIEKPLYKKLLILEADRSACELAKNFPESNGILVKTATLLHQKGDKESLIILLKDERFYDVFISLIDDIITSLIGIEDDSEAVKTLILRLKKWQIFMEQYTEGLGEEAIRGLFGELYFLLQFVLLKYGLEGIKSWKGFQKTNQDFYFKNVAIEAKTTTGREPSSIRISSERQLDRNGYKNLFIFHISMENTEEKGTTLPDLIFDIKNKIAGNDDLIDYFEAGLFETGYIDAHKDKYTCRFSVRNTSFYEVSDLFPKIIESGLPNGVGDVQYGISISECRHFMVEEEKVIKLLKYE